MPSLAWSVFKLLPGGKSENFEQVCRQVIRLRFGRYGQFKASPNQPGVEFHLKLTHRCTLGEPPKWLGWQCKFHERNQNKTLKASSCRSIESSLKTTKEFLPELTDWILWTPYTLSRKDQKWFYQLDDNINLVLWTDSELDCHLSGPAIYLRNTYFGELVLTPEILAGLHNIAIQPIKERWLQPLHQQTDAESRVRRMLGESEAWDEFTTLGKDLERRVGVISNVLKQCDREIEDKLVPFLRVCGEFVGTLLQFHNMLERGDYEIIFQTLAEQKCNIDVELRSVPRWLRKRNHPISLDATNALDDVRKSQILLNEIAEYLELGMVAILSDAGGGKTQLAAQLSAPQKVRPAGIFFQGQSLSSGDTLDDLAKRYSAIGIKFDSMEDLLAALNAAGIRAFKRLPILIDGLNEAENPKNWKSELARLSEVVKNYPNVFVVCTLRTGEHRPYGQSWRPKNAFEQREAFANMSLPKDVTRIKSEGFGENTRIAIERYFEYYRIIPSGVEIPIDFLSHPLNLRIYCEVTNRKRESEVTVNKFPASLTLLFDQYFSNVYENIVRMTNLSYSYTTEEIKSVVYKLGIELWDTGNRNVSERKFRDLVSDSPRQWDASIVNLLAQEGVIFRNPSVGPEQFTIMPAYDALGGYVVSSALLIKYSQDQNFNWLKEKKVKNMLVGKKSHELASNIIASLITLAPIRTNGQQLWKVAPDYLKNACLIFTSKTEAEYIDQETVSALTDLFVNNSDVRVDLIARLKQVRGVSDHPLNAKFIDHLLRQINLADRDLSWTEWVRNYELEILEEIVELEKRWKSNISLRTSTDRLRADWMKWYLTSTNHQLRDVATRALYWFGRGAPGELFEETISSLDIDDPYVSERMLAASYGVAMANCTDSEGSDFVDTVLSNYARVLFEKVFAVDAPFSTTHILEREYAFRTIELAATQNESLFTDDELNLSTPPFADSGSRDWGEVDIDMKQRNHTDSPFRMDFENYTIGSLIPGRGSYDYKNARYRKVRAQILWRVKQLGWSSDKFGEIDARIGSKTFYRHENNATRIDRYGKKYSWIAYFEMSGLLHDSGDLRDDYERTFSIDIDPSFPDQGEKGSVIDTNYLGDQEIEMLHWMKLGSPEISLYLNLEKLREESGPWILLDGSFSQEDENLAREIFCIVRGFFVTNNDADAIIDRLSTMYVGGGWLPDKPSVSLTFAGEIPWCSTFPCNGISGLKIKIDEVPVQVEKTEIQYYLDGKNLNISTSEIMQLRMFGSLNDDLKNNPQLSDEEWNRIEEQEVTVEVEEMQPKYEEYEVVVPVCDYSGLGSTTVTNEGTRATILAKEISSELSLIVRPQGLESFAPDGSRATCNISDQSTQYGNNQSLFYFREDLLKSYLNQKDLTLIWAIWGERKFSSNLMLNRVDQSDSSYLNYETFSSIESYKGC